MVNDVIEKDEPVEMLELVDNGEGRDYVLTGNSCWIEVGNVGLYIRKFGAGVIVEATPADDPEDTIDTMEVEV